MPSQVENGKAFEFSIANCYYNYLKNNGVNVVLVEDASYENAKRCYKRQACCAQNIFNSASLKTVETLLVLEPGLTAQQNHEDILQIRIASDSEGEQGDVRDVIFNRKNISPAWEVGFSAKNNHEAVKHSRLSMKINFGERWLNHPCSLLYFQEIAPIFEMLQAFRRDTPAYKWSLIEDKESKVYVPLLKAFRKEMLRLSHKYSDVPRNLLCYLIGRYPFYKIIKDDTTKTVVVKAFNIEGKLNRTVNGQRARVKTDKIKLPTRIIEFDFVKGSKTTLMMVLDEGWQISFRIHNASNLIEPSLKFDIQLIGNPPVLFTQHLFNLD